ncbi:MAG: hypothetical protein K1X35_05000 [Caulobacteraceae bacterium]|nr:hypothetical protein [Caulobacteraceae bacterium]
MEAFGALAKLTGFLNKPKDEDFGLVCRERRDQPYWRIIAAATYLYERNRTYEAPAAPEVKGVEAMVGKKG